MHKYLEETTLLDWSHPSLAGLIETRNWKDLDPHRAIGAAYDFVQNEIPFGYNVSDELPASAVLADGYGQCNTKGTLLMALLRGLGIPCRFHGFTIDKRLQRGAVAGLAYWLAPRDIIHSWVEVFHDGRWLNLEGFILDRGYLEGVRCTFPNASGAFCGYAVGTTDIQNPPVAWNGTDTYIQSTGINRDYGVFDSPDELYARHGSNLTGFRRVLYRNIVRHAMNAKVARIRRRAAFGLAHPDGFQASSAHAGKCALRRLLGHVHRARARLHRSIEHVPSGPGRHR